jgi:hypothetical protein
VGRRISDILEDFCDQLKTLRLALQVDDVTDIVKGTHLITYGGLFVLQTS